MKVKSKGGGDVATFIFEMDIYSSDTFGGHTKKPLKAAPIDAGIPRSISLERMQYYFFVYADNLPPHEVPLNKMAGL